MSESISTYSQPTPCAFGQETIFKIGEVFASQVNYDSGGDLDLVVRKYGGKISYQDFFDLDSSSSGSILIEGEADFQIFLANHTSEARDRFTICHELGHYVLHYLYPRVQGNPIAKLRAGRYGTGPCEYEANWFAAAFLMPAAKFSEAFKEFSGNIDLLASRFGVSAQSAAIRVDALSLSK